jgi:prepilin-type N-terminal cleavage/methylation domain-containing protein
VKKPLRFSGLEPARSRAGFTLVEVILVMVIIAILSGISLPYFAGAFRGHQLRSSARTINRMARYARSMSIMREEQMTVVLNHETLEVFLGASTQTATNAADGELNQDVLKRLGYVEGGEGANDNAGIEKEIHRLLPEGLVVREFKKDWLDEDDRYEDLYLIRYYPDGQSEWFVLELEDQRGNGVRLENDPISGKIISEFMQ